MQEMTETLKKCLNGGKCTKCQFGQCGKPIMCCKELIETILQKLESEKMIKKNIFQMRISKETRENLNLIAKHYNLSASATVDMLIAKETRLIDKQRKEDENE